jgi:hypothetical protein
MQLTRAAKPPIGDPRFMGVAGPAGVVARSGSDRACSAVEGAPDVLPTLIRERLRAEGSRLPIPAEPRGQLCHRLQLVTHALPGAKAEPEPAVIMNLGAVMQPAGAVSYTDEGDRR